MKIYNFDYNTLDAEAKFKVDTEIFTVDMAKATLEFFSWDYDNETDPVDEVMKKYAMEAIKIATFNNCNVNGVIREFMNNEGFGRVDGSIGITLLSISKYEFDDYALEMTVVTE